MATAVSANNADFQMNADYTIGGVVGNGSYALSETGYNGNPTPYQAETNGLSVGDNYGTNEIIDGVVVGTCTATTTPEFTLAGYSSGDTLTSASTATKTMTAPMFTNLQSSKFVIVWNNKCPSTTGGTVGNIGGDVTGGQSAGTLSVTSVDTVDSSAVADGTFTNGWIYVFNVTLPTNETHLSMKFADWMITGGGSTIPVANNMRIASAQADNGGATVLLTAANTYSSPTLNMISDLDPLTAGIQVKVSVEVSIPVGSVNGSYTTSYGVKTI
jgi:hypothetical protein